MLLLMYRWCGSPVWLPASCLLFLHAAAAWLLFWPLLSLLLISWAALCLLCFAFCSVYISENSGLTEIDGFHELYTFGVVSIYVRLSCCCGCAFSVRVACMACFPAWPACLLYRTAAAVCRWRLVLAPPP